MRAPLPFLALACLAFAAGGCVNVGPRRTVLAAERVELPTVGMGDALLIRVQLNGAGPFWLLVDTGTDGLVLTSKAAAAARLKASGHALLVTPAGAFRSALARVDRLESGGLVLEGIDAVVLGDDRAAFVRQHGVAGFAGIGLFRKVVLEIDYPEQQVSVAAAGAEDFRQRPFTSYAGTVPRVTLSIGGRLLPAVVDTGSDFCLIVPELPSYRLAAPIRLDETGGAAVGSRAPDREANSQLLGDARWGPMTWRNPPLRQQRPGQDANIGAKALDGLALAFDERAHRIYFLGGELDRAWNTGQGQPSADR